MCVCESAECGVHTRLGRIPPCIYVRMNSQFAVASLSWNCLMYLHRRESPVLRSAAFLCTFWLGTSAHRHRRHCSPAENRPCSQSGEKTISRLLFLPRRRRRVHTRSTVRRFASLFEVNERSTEQPKQSERSEEIFGTKKTRKRSNANDTNFQKINEKKAASGEEAESGLDIRSSSAFRVRSPSLARAVLGQKVLCARNRLTVVLSSKSSDETYRSVFF